MSTPSAQVKLDFDSVCNENYEGVHRFCLRYCRDRADAEDLTQETFRRACRAYPRYTGTAPLTLWLRAIARNTCIDGARARAKLGRLTSLEDLCSFGEFDAPASSRRPDDIVADRFLLAAVMSELQNFDPISRLLFVMLNFEGLEHAEVAERVGLKIGAVKSRAHRITVALRQRLGHPEADYCRSYYG